MITRSLLPLALLAAGLAAAQAPLVDNLDLSRGAEGWTDWSDPTPHAWTIDPAVGHAGKPSIRIDATDPRSNLMVMTATDRLQPGQRYAFTVWWRTQDLAPGSGVDFRVIFRKPDGAWLTGTDCYASTSRTEGEWTGKVYRVSVPQGAGSASIGIWVRDATGTIWVSDMSVEPQPVGQRTFDSMYQYDPEQVELGMAPLRANYALKEAGSPFLARADRWNRLLVDLGFWQEDVNRARRAAAYRGGDSAATREADAALERALAALDTLQQTYGRLYAAKDTEGLAAQFDPAAEALERDVKAGHAAVLKLLAGLRQAPAAGEWLTLPEAPTNGPWWDAQRGRARYTLWNRWSDNAFRANEEPLDLGDVQTLTVGAPKAFVNGVADWSNYVEQRAGIEAAGAKRFTLITHWSLHDKGYLAPEFVEQHGNDPDLRMWNLEGQPIGPPSGVTMANWLNPDVRAHMRDVLTQMARFFKDQPEYQFYVTSWESAGPYAEGVRVGENPSHKVAFRQWLAKEYGTVAALNQAWGTQHASFEELSPEREQPTAPGEASTPLAIESQRWAHESYIDYLKDITGTLNAVDPAKPVFGEQSGLLDRVLSPNVIDSVNLLGYHHHGRTTMPVQVWLASLSRVTGRPTGLYENFWGCQEEHPQRMTEEKVMRAAMRRYLFRHAAWGRCTQTWWYAYTSAPYLLVYNGNWFNPVYDLTTFRYSAAGLPVEKAKADRFDGALLGSEIVAPRLLLVQPYASMLAQGPRSSVWSEWLAWHYLLYDRDQLYDALPDTWFGEGRVRLSDYDAVILPVATHLDRRFTEQLLAFLNAGGTVIASGPPALFNELGKPDGRLLAAAAVTATRTSEAGKPWQFGYGAAPATHGAVEAAVGRGKLLLLPQSVTATPDKGFALAERLRAVAAPVAEAPGTDLELLLRRLPDGRHLLCALNRNVDQATGGEVSVAGAFGRVADVDMPEPCAVPSRAAEGRTRFNVRLEAGETAYFLLAL